MFYPMNTTLMFAAASLILVAGIVTVAIPGTVYADPKPPAAKIVCVDGQAGALCGSTMKECKAILNSLAGDHKCIHL